MMTHDIFISYSSKQKSIADGVCHYLEENGFKCWMAPRDIPVGSKYGDLIERAIKTCKIVVLVFSEAASLSNWVEGEINVAFTEHKPILPFRIDETEITGGFRVMLNQMHWIDAFPHYADRLPDLLNSVCGFLGCQAQKVSDESARKYLTEKEGTKEHRTKEETPLINYHSATSFTKKILKVKWWVFIDIFIVILAFFVSLFVISYHYGEPFSYFDLNRIWIVPIVYHIAFLIAHIYDVRLQTFNFKNNILRIVCSCLGAGAFLVVSKAIIAQLSPLSPSLAYFLYPSFATMVFHCFITLIMMIIVRFLSR